MLIRQLKCWKVQNKRKCGDPSLNMGYFQDLRLLALESLENIIIFSFLIYRLSE